MTAPLAAYMVVGFCLLALMEAGIYRSVESLFGPQRLAELLMFFAFSIWLIWFPREDIRAHMLRIALRDGGADG